MTEKVRVSIIIKCPKCGHKWVENKTLTIHKNKEKRNIAS